MADTTGIGISAALVAGLVGSGHCFAMCGGLAAALGMRARIAGASYAATLRNIVAYQLGRIGGYMLAGALVGFFGTALQSALNFPELAISVRVASAVLLVLVAIRILSGWNVLAFLEHFGARLWRTLQPMAKHAAARREMGSSLLFGLVWGWLPCGLVYSMLLFAALSGSAWTGAALMLAFGIGTLPAMLSSGVLASSFQALFRQRWPRAVSGVLLLVFGAWLGVAAINTRRVEDHHEHHDFLTAETEIHKFSADAAACAYGAALCRWREESAASASTTTHRRARSALMRSVCPTELVFTSAPWHVHSPHRTCMRS